MLAFIKSLRPKQWIKNLLVFAGLVFAQRWDDPRMVINAILGFAVFCALSGLVYVINDVVDLEQDRQHPKKSKRPMASGAIKPGTALMLAITLAVVGLGVSFLYLPLPFAFLAVIYMVLTSAYSFKLKHVVILDILLLAVGFVLRALAGIEVIQIYPSDPVEVTSFFLMTTLFLALFLAAAKRRSEMVTLGMGAGNHRKVLEHYSTEFLDIILTIATAGTLFSYAQWTTRGQFSRGDDGGLTESGAYLLVLTMPFVIYGIFRYLWLVLQKDEGGAPEALLFEDIPLLATVALWMITVVAVLVHLS